jgi:uncharacterized membrane protein
MILEVVFIRKAREVFQSTCDGNFSEFSHFPSDIETFRVCLNITVVSRLLIMIVLFGVVHEALRIEIREKEY